MKKKKMQNQKVKKIINLIEKQKYQKAEILFRRIIKKEFPNDENIKYAFILTHYSECDNLILF